MTLLPETELVGRRFAAAAAGYDAAAWHQDRIAATLCERLPDGLLPRRIVEWGCGTGLLTARLAARWPRVPLTAIDLAPAMLARGRDRVGAGAAIRWIQADAEQYDVAEPADLLASSCAVQWFRSPGRLASCAARQLAPGGWLALAIPVQGTLCELWQSLAASGYSGPTGLPLERPADYRARFAGPGWRAVSVDTATFVRHHADARAVLRTLREIGATCTGHGAWAHLTATAMRRLLAVYDAQHSTPAGVRCTYVAAFVRAQRTAAEVG